MAWIMKTGSRPPQVGDDMSDMPPFTLSDIRNAIPDHCWERNAAKSMSYLVRDVAIVAGLAAAAYAINSWCATSQLAPISLQRALARLKAPDTRLLLRRFVWPLYWLAQGTMFWALFVIGHDWCAYLLLRVWLGGTGKQDLSGHECVALAQQQGDF